MPAVTTIARIVRRPFRRGSDDGVNARRARIGVIGKLFGDWNYALIYDFAGSSDGFASTASVRGASVGFLPGGALSGIENAYLSYTGFKPFGGKLAIEGGYLDVPYTLDEATSSNDILFLERASSQVIAAMSPPVIPLRRRRALVHRLILDRRLCDRSDARRDPLSIEHEPEWTTEQLGAAARIAGQVVTGKDYSLHIGGDADS